jgi:hypothetical protein
MGPVAHAGLAALTGLAVYTLGGRAEGAIAALLAGTLIDADHLLDYVLSEGLRFDFTVLSSGSYFHKADRAIVLLHSYELVTLSAVGCWLAGRRALGVGLFAGAMIHLGSDIRFYGFRPLAYSLLYRGVNGFRLDAYKCRPLPPRGCEQIR